MRNSNICSESKQATLFQIVNESEPIHTVETHRKYIGWPCDVAQDLPIDDRPKHIKDCVECKRLLDELEKRIGVKT